MSLDYPKREDWLKVRDAQRNTRLPRVLWAGAGTWVKGHNRAKRMGLAKSRRKVDSVQL